MNITMNIPRYGILFASVMVVAIAAVATNYITKWSVNVSCIRDHNPDWNANLPSNWKRNTQFCFYHTKTWDGKVSILADQISGPEAERVSTTATGSAVGVSASTNGVSLSSTVSTETVMQHLNIGATVMIDPKTDAVWAVLKGESGNITREPIGKIRSSDGVFLRGGQSGFHCLEVQQTSKISEDIGTGSSERSGYYTQAVIRPIIYKYTMGEGDRSTIVSAVFNVIFYEIKRRHYL